MPTLRALQQRLATEIRSHAEGVPVPNQDLCAGLRLPPGVEADTRLAICRDGYPARIIEALQEGFPAIANICGDGSFTMLVGRFVRDSDVSSTSLNRIGERFPAHCDHDQLATRLPFLGDLAKLEWAALAALHSADLPPVDPAGFAAWDMEDWERVVLTFQPSTGLIGSQWPIHDLWSSRHTPRTEIDIDLTNRPQSVLVQRRHFDVECRALSATESIVLEALLAGMPLGRAIGGLAEHRVEPEIDPSQMFGQWLTAGLISAATLA